MPSEIQLHRAHVEDDKTESPAAGFFENIGVTRSLSRLELRGGAIGRNEPSRLVPLHRRVDILPTSKGGGFIRH